jgi:hypothetical protein
MKKHIRFVAVALACGLAISLLPTPHAAAQMSRGSRGTIVNPFPPYNPFLNYALTPYMSVGQYLGIRNTLLYSSLFGRLPPGPNAFLNYPLTPYMGVGQAAAMLAMSGGGFGGYSPFGGGYSPLQPALYGGVPYPGYGYGGYGYGGTPGYAGTSNLAGYANTQSQELTTIAKPINALDQLRTVGGGLEWPLGLRVLEPKEQSKELRKHIDEQVVAMFRDKDGFQATPQLLQEITKDIEKLGNIFKSHVWDMALTRQQETEVKQFLGRVRAALAAAEDSTRRSETQLKTTGGGQSASPKGGGQAQPPTKPSSKY